MYEFFCVKAGPDIKTISLDQTCNLLHATLDINFETKNPTSVIIEYDDRSFILCTLTPEVCENFNFSLELPEKQTFRIFTTEKNSVYLNGIYTNNISERKSKISIFYLYLKPYEESTLNIPNDVEFTVATLDNKNTSLSRTSVIVEIEECDVTLCTLIPYNLNNTSFSFAYKSNNTTKFKLIGQDNVFLIGKIITYEEKNQ
ncbi:hypothetical protein CWI37_0752p0010 [Hamiltosporidium tvaerminnensis]|uniref:Nucleoplasmin-like domain-containing protein n=2 Tax=Hamiltosporidium TaxID=1176354 RepID=A0A4Q9LDH2_9MICR|nr:hypothetical protein CWI37_0752p0010 [Hamiltosporidium tvaerminnensis]TBU05081.1 hypothetical protein CWI39_0721p0010 [Hamiltosporidium magnivora]